MDQGRDCRVDGNDVLLAARQLGQVLHLGNQSTHVCGSGPWDRPFLCGPANCQSPFQAAGALTLRSFRLRHQNQKKEKNAEQTPRRKTTAD